MGRLVDLDDLIDSAETAREVGLSDRKSLAAALSNPRRGVWRTFPEQVKGPYWYRPDVRAWDDERRRNPPKRGRKPKGASG